MKKTYELDGLTMISHMYWPLKEKYFLRLASPILLFGMIFWAMWMYQMVNGITYVASRVFIPI